MFILLLSNHLSAFSEIVGVFVGLYLILYTRRKWLWTGMMSIATGLFANLAWSIPEHRKCLIVVIFQSY